MLMIIICHILQYYGNELAWWFNCGVQIFLCISGYLYGKKEIQNDYTFIRNRFAKILVKYYICIGFSMILVYVLANKIWTIGEMINLVFCYGTVDGLQHLWFVRTILLCYLFTPVLGAACHAMTGKKWAEMRYTAFILILCLLVQIYIPVIKPIHILCYIAGFCFRRFEEYHGTQSKKIITVEIGIVMLCFAINGYRIFVNYIINISASNSVLRLLNVVAANFGHLFLGLALFVVMVRGYKYLGKLPCIKRFIKITDNFSYDIYLAHHIWILGPISVLDIEILPGYKMIILIICIIMESVLIHYGEKLYKHLTTRWCIN